MPQIHLQCKNFRIEDIKFYFFFLTENEVLFVETINRYSGISQ